MSHLIMAPILLPLFTAILIMLPPIHFSLVRRRRVSMLSSVIQLALAILLLLQVKQFGIIHYAVGDWQAPFGIIVVADLVSVLLVCLTSFLALAAICYGSAGEDEKGAFFHPLFQFQLMGINGAFLTGDLFNMFVFFEVLLIASYALLIHGGGKNKTKAAIHYVVLNLTGSAIFLISLAVLYGTLGTLNMADMIVKVATLAPENVMIVKAGGLMLMIVFALKAAVLPLQFWLPATYSSASAPVAALFAVMTKIGVYGLLRVYSTIFGETAGPLAGMVSSWLMPAGLATMVLGAIGALASQDFRKMVANLVLVSVGVLICLVALGSVASASAALYYTIHSTLIAGAMFLLADLIANQRAKASDRLVSGRQVTQPVLLGSLFIMAALTISGLPPFSGFIGKIMILQAVTEPFNKWLIWAVVLVTSLMVIVALSRAGSILFWRISATQVKGEKAAKLQLFAVFLLIISSPLLVIFAGPFADFTYKAALELHDVPSTINIILEQTKEGANL